MSTSKSTNTTLLQLIKVHVLFELVEIDIIRSMSITIQEYKFILVITDYLSKSYFRRLKDSLLNIN
jgi:hypothetical protein